ncbi:MAG: response regulator [Deltaproteobacteria bacterium]|nr:response regulator [Deltaproteobacteria bacterium]
MNADTSPEADRLQILVVDDTPDNLKLLTNILTKQGYQVRSASSGPQALRSVAVEAPDLILLDVRMPEMDGYEVCHHLKSHEQSRGIPVIFISALTDIAEKMKGFGAGGVDYIIKPFELTEVLARVETHLALRRLQKQLEEQNIQLQQEIMVRRQTEEELRKHKAQLEDLVEERTAGIRKINEELHHEITERKQAEEAFKNLIYSAPIGIFVVQDGKFKMVNPGFRKTTGYSEIELIEQDSLFLVVPEFKEIVRNKSAQMLLEQSTSPYEYQLVDKNGGIHWVLERVTSTLYGGEKAVLGYFMDITERKRAADILFASKARYREILSQTENS